MIELKTEYGGRYKMVATKRDGSQRVLAEFDDTTPRLSLAYSVQQANKQVSK